MPGAPAAEGEGVWPSRAQPLEGREPGETGRACCVRPERSRDPRVGGTRSRRTLGQELGGAVALCRRASLRNGRQRLPACWAAGAGAELGRTRVCSGLWGWRDPSLQLAEGEVWQKPLRAEERPLGSRAGGDQGSAPWPPAGEGHAGWPLPIGEARQPVTVLQGGDQRGSGPLS